MVEVFSLVTGSSTSIKYVNNTKALYEKSVLVFKGLIINLWDRLRTDALVMNLMPFV